MTKREPWQDPPVHSAAALLPMMSDAELEALAADIKANGLQQPIVVWVDNTEAAEGGEGPFPTYLLDGRNRLAALKLLGIKDPRDAPRAKAAQHRPGWSVRSLSALVETRDFTSRSMSKPKWRPGLNPTTFVLSMNVHRRHLTSEQKRDAIAAYLKADPTVSNLKVAKDLGASDKTAAKVRDELERRSEIPNVSERTDSAGRKQPARKPNPKPPKPEPVNEAKPAAAPEPKPEPIDDPKPEPPGGLTKDSPGYTDRVKEAVAKARAKPQEPAVETQPEPVEADSPVMKNYLLVVHSDGRAHIHVTFCDSAATRNIWLDDQFDSLITPSVAADLAHYLRTMPTHIQEVLERLEHRAKQR